MQWGGIVVLLAIAIERGKRCGMLESRACPGGETGRHPRLKISCQKWRTGSIPVPGTRNLLHILQYSIETRLSHSECGSFFVTRLHGIARDTIKSRAFLMLNAKI